MNNKIIILSTGLFLLISFVFLSVIEKNQADINKKNVWFVYFENPKDNSLNFAIENHSNSNNFHWEVIQDKNKIQANDVTVATGSIKNIPLTLSDAQNKKITVKVTDGNNSKEIYKIFGN